MQHFADNSLMLLAFSLLTCVSQPVLRADEIVPAGPDLLVTLPGTFFVVGGVTVPLLGIPGATGADTTVQRLSDINIDDTVGSSQTIDTMLTQLDLQSVGAVNFGGSLFDVFVHLTPGVASPGMLTATQTINGEGIPEGTFISFFDVFFTLSFTTPAGTPVPCILPNGCNLELTLTSSPPGLWTDDLPGQFIVGSVMEVHPGSGVHLAEPIPEPASTLLVGAGLVAIGWIRRRKAV